MMPLPAKGPRIITLGVGTGVGKTYVTRALAHALQLRGHATTALKPIESGYQEPSASDAAALDRASNPHRSDSTFVPPLYAFADAVSPHLAARRAGIRICLGRIRDWVELHSATVTLVESAGGAYSPLSPTATNADLVRALLPAVVLLVACDRLGVLHEVHTTMATLRADGHPPPLLILSAPNTPDGSTGTNGDELARLGHPPIISLPHALDPASVAVQRALAPLVQRLRR